MSKELPGVRGFGFIRQIERSQLTVFLKALAKMELLSFHCERKVPDLQVPFL